MASPWSDAGIASKFLDERSLFFESARGALGDGGEAGRVALGHCPGMHLSADVPLNAMIEHMFLLCQGQSNSYRDESPAFDRGCVTATTAGDAPLFFTTERFLKRP